MRVLRNCRTKPTRDLPGRAGRCMWASQSTPCSKRRRRWRLATSRWARGRLRGSSWSRLTMGRSRGSAACSSRTSSSGANCGAWLLPPPSNSASTWARSTWSCRWPRPGRCPPACSGSGGRGTGWASRAGAGSSPSTAPTCWRRPRWWSACTPERSSTPATCATPSMSPPSRSWPCAPWTTGRSSGWQPCCGAPLASPICPTRCCTACSSCCRAPTQPRSSPS